MSNVDVVENYVGPSGPGRRGPGRAAHCTGLSEFRAQGTYPRFLCLASFWLVSTTSARVWRDVVRGSPLPVQGLGTVARRLCRTSLITTRPPLPQLLDRANESRRNGGCRWLPRSFKRLARRLPFPSSLFFSFFAISRHMRTCPHGPVLREINFRLPTLPSTSLSRQR